METYSNNVFFSTFLWKRWRFMLNNSNLVIIIQTVLYWLYVCQSSKIWKQIKSLMKTQLFIIHVTFTMSSKLTVIKHIRNMEFLEIALFQNIKIYIFTIHLICFIKFHEIIYYTLQRYLISYMYVHFTRTTIMLNYIRILQHFISYCNINLKMDKRS